VEHKFQIQIKVQKNARLVFEAVRDPGELSKYFTTAGADGAIEAGCTVNWKFQDSNEKVISVPVHGEAVEQDRKIRFRWAASDGVYDAQTGARPRPGGYETTVEFSFEPLRADETLVRITEGVWRATEGGLQGSYQNCQGWMQMLCCLKAYLEHGINLRKGSF
jgi:uncharacterized protein YndB with AHSA1/START domain